MDAPPPEVAPPREANGFEAEVAGVEAPTPPKISNELDAGAADVDAAGLVDEDCAEEAAVANRDWGFFALLDGVFPNEKGLDCEFDVDSAGLPKLAKGFGFAVSVDVVLVELLGGLFPNKLLLVCDTEVGADESAGLL